MMNNSNTNNVTTSSSSSSAGRKVRLCGICRQAGHNRRTCKEAEVAVGLKSLEKKEKTEDKYHGLAILGRCQALKEALKEVTTWYEGERLSPKHVRFLEATFARRAGDKNALSNRIRHLESQLHQLKDKPSFKPVLQAWRDAMDELAKLEREEAYHIANDPVTRRAQYGKADFDQWSDEELEAARDAAGARLVKAERVLSVSGSGDQKKPRWYAMAEFQCDLLKANVAPVSLMEALDREMKRHTPALPNRFKAAWVIAKRRRDAYNRAFYQLRREYRALVNQCEYRAQAAEREALGGEKPDTFTVWNTSGMAGPTECAEGYDLPTLSANLTGVEVAEMTGKPHPKAPNVPTSPGGHKSEMTSERLKRRREIDAKWRTENPGAVEAFLARKQAANA